MLLSAHVISLPDEPRGALSVILWWESRRALFNIVVGVCGLPTIAFLYYAGLAKSSFLLLGTVEYGFLANVCFTFGWICELVARSWWQERAKHLGPIFFSLGFAFSVLLTIGAGILTILLFGGLSLFRM